METTVQIYSEKERLLKFQGNYQENINEEE